MDALDDLIYDARAHGALFKQSILDPPWALRFLDGAPLTLVSMLRGDAWIRPGDEPPVRIGPHDVAIVTGTAPFTVSDRPDTPPQVLLHSRTRATDRTGTEVGESMWLGVRTCGDRLDAPTALLRGTYDMDGSVGARLLSALPRVLVVPGDNGPSPALALAVDEVTREAPGQQVMLDRLLDLILVTTLREWFARPEAQAPAWYQALADPIVGQAIRLMHNDPALPWTVASLATGSGASRAALARRFGLLVGEPPMSYLTNWRMCVASDLLRRTDDTIAAIARRVGYANAYAFSAAFTRAYGVRPGRHRREELVTAVSSNPERSRTETVRNSS